MTIRAVTPRDASALRRIVALESLPLRGHALMAERGGVALAAIALTSGSVLADSRHATGDAVRLLRLRRYQLLRQGGDVAPAWSLLRRLAPAS